MTTSHPTDPDADADSDRLSALRRRLPDPTAVALLGVFVGLLAFGLTGGNLAARDNGWVPLIWLQAVLPGVVAAWWLGGAPGWPRQAPPAVAAP